MKLIDTHTHVATDTVSHCTAMLDELEASMEQAGISAAVVMPLAPKGFSAIKELEVLITCVADRSRLKPMLCYDKVAGKDGIRVLLDLLECKKVAGVKFFTGYDHYFPDAEEIAPVLDVIVARGLVAKFHTGATARTEQARLRFSSDPCSFDDLAVLRPTLKIDCAHFMAPNHSAMAPVLDKNENVFADLSGLIDRYSSGYDNPYAAFVKYRLADALAYLPTSQQIMFGSDFPFCRPTEMVEFFESFFLEYGYGNEQQMQIRYKNAAEVYGFDGIS